MSTVAEPGARGAELPLVFRAGDVPAAAWTVQTPPHGATRLAVRVCVRALHGMQKEAVVATSAGPAWRMLSDEGPYLNGTDLAPFPLAFFTAGMQFSLLGELARHAASQRLSVTGIGLGQDNCYTMDGSALKGTMRGGARAAALQLSLDCDAPADRVARLIRDAELTSPAHALMRDPLANTFALNLNGSAVPVTGVAASAMAPDEDPLAAFRDLAPRAGDDWRADIITKLDTAQTLFGVEGGAGSSLQAEQKRELHVRGEARFPAPALMETSVQLFKPIGSVFRFRCDGVQASTSAGQTPPALAFLMAGVGFCFMTQIGRYAQITKQELRSYAIVQDSTFDLGAGAARALPTHTQVFLDTAQSPAVAQKFVQMAEQTCFLHAAMRTCLPSRIDAKLNGKELPLPR